MIRFRRYAKVIIKDREVEGLRIRFRVKKDLKKTPNSLDLQVYNLSAQSRALLQDQTVPIVLAAGYEKDAEIIFSGMSKAVDHARDGAEQVTHVQCGDGERAFRCYSSFSFGQNARMADVLERVCQDLGVDSGDAVQRIRRGDVRGGSDVFRQGYTATGRSVRELDKVVRAAGLEWSIQDEQLQLLEPGGTTRETALDIGPETGLVASPEHKLEQVPLSNDTVAVLRVTCLLHGSIRPGRLVQLNAANVKGLVRVEAVEHSGDTHGGDWNTTFDGRPR